MAPWHESDPQAGLNKRHTALVMGLANCNGKAGLMDCCSMYAQIKVYLFDAWS
jgi:hypothetical protein